MEQLMNTRTECITRKLIILRINLIEWTRNWIRNSWTDQISMILNYEIWSRTWLLLVMKLKSWCLFRLRRETIISKRIQRNGGGHFFWRWHPLVLYPDPGSIFPEGLPRKLLKIIIVVLCSVFKFYNRFAPIIGWRTLLNRIQKPTHPDDDRTRSIPEPIYIFSLTCVKTRKIQSKTNVLKGGVRTYELRTNPSPFASSPYFYWFIYRLFHRLDQAIAF